jgi:hypothetical protein
VQGPEGFVKQVGEVTPVENGRRTGETPGLEVHSSLAPLDLNQVGAAHAARHSSILEVPRDVMMAI